jgi:hypothetical protein
MVLPFSFLSRSKIVAAVVVSVYAIVFLMLNYKEKKA